MQTLRWVKKAINGVATLATSRKVPKLISKYQGIMGAVAVARGAASGARALLFCSRRAPRSAG